MNFEQFVTALAGSLGDLDVTTLSESTVLEALPQWDSLAMLLTIDLVEEHCGITLSSRVIRDCNTLGELYALIAAHKS